MSEMKNTLDRINRRLAATEDKISELEKHETLKTYMETQHRKLEIPRFITYIQNSIFLYLGGYLTSDVLGDSQASSTEHV